MQVEKRPMLHHDAVEKQVEDLRERMRLLQQDRRANMDLLEASKVSNGNEIRCLKDENKKLRLRLTNLQKSASVDQDSNQGDLDNFKKLVLQKRSEYDAQKVSTDKLGNSLTKLKDEARVCRLEEKRPSQEDGPLSRKIRLLENKLDKAMIQYNEAQGICSTYEHIVKRLKDERISFDNQLTALERTLQSKQRDYDELVLLSGDASHAREVAQLNLHKSKCSLEEGKTRRARDIRERQQHVKIRKQMIQKQERSEEERRKALRASSGSDSGDISASSSSMTSPVPIGSSSAQTIEDQESTLSVYENAFRKIKDATGVSNVNEVIRKIVGQESTTENLALLSKQNQSRIEDLARLKETVARGVEEAKYSAAGPSEDSKSLDEQNDHLHSRSSLFQRTKSQFDRLELVIVSIKAGVEHLRDKLGFLPDDEFEIDDELILESNLPDIIRSSGDTLLEVHSKTREKELKLNLKIQDIKFTELERSASRGGTLRAGLLGKKDASGRSINQRISLPSAKEASAFDNECDVDSVFGDLDGEEEISRDGLKKASSNIIATEERRKLRSRKIQEE